MDPQHHAKTPDARWLHRSSAALLLVSGAAIVVFGVVFRRTELSVTSEPPGATVRVDGVFAGVAPTQVGGLTRGRHLVVVTKHRCRTWRRALHVKGRHMSVKATLDRLESGTITVQSDPPGAAAMLDGVHRGSTPLTIDPVAPGSHRVCLASPGCEPWAGTVTVAPGEHLALNPALASHTAEYYKRRLQREPHNLHHIIELGHYYVLQHRFDSAEQTFKRAREATKGRSWIDDAETRFYRELDNIHSGQFDYGDYDQVRLAQAMVVRVLTAMIKAKPHNALARYTLGCIMAREGKYSEARRQLVAARRSADTSQLQGRIDRALRKLYR